MSKEVPATEEKKEAPAVTDELLQELDKNPAKIRELDPALRDAVLAKKMSGDESTPDEEDPEGNDGGESPDESGKADDGKEAGKESAEGKPAKEEKPAESLSADEKRDRIRELSNESNRLEQKLKAAQARKEKAQAAYDKAVKEGKPVPDDPFGDENVLKEQLAELVELRGKVARLETLLESDAEESESSIKAELETTRERGVFAEFEDLQDRYPDLKTKTPISELNAQYARALDSIVEEQGLKAANPDATPQQLREKAIAWYNAADEASRATVKVPFPDEMDKLSIALELWGAKQSLGGTLRGHWLQRLEDSGTLHDTVQKSTQNGAKEAARKVVAEVKKQGTEVSTIAPGDGSTDGFGKKPGMTRAQAREVLARLNPKAGKWSPAERKEHDEAMQVMSDPGAQ